MDPWQVKGGIRQGWFEVGLGWFGVGLLVGLGWG